MDVYQPRRKRPRRHSYWARPQHVLLVLIILCVIGITAVALVLAREYAGYTGPGPHPTLSPVTSPLPTHTLTLSPTPLSPSPSPTSASTPTPPSSPTPEPTPPPGVLGFPLYSGNAHLPEIALTFDDGPTPPYTPQILALLQHYGVPATFFVIGSQAAAYPDLVQQESQQGHRVGNHTWTHPDLTTLPPVDVRAQLQSASREIEADTNQAPTLMRPPGGHFNGEVQSIAASLGLSTILWSVDPRDWSRPGTDKIIQSVLDTTHNGSIILLHDGGGDRSETVAALPTIIISLQQRGFQFVTIPRMIQDLPPGVSIPSSISPDQLTPLEVPYELAETLQSARDFALAFATASPVGRAHHGDQDYRAQEWETLYLSGLLCTRRRDLAGDQPEGTFLVEKSPGWCPGHDLSPGTPLAS